MSESAAKRQPIDLDEFERRLRGPSPATRSDDDPLAELARLVNMGSPFGQPRNAPPVEPPAPAAPQLRVVEPSLPPEPEFEPQMRAPDPQAYEEPPVAVKPQAEPYFEAAPELRGSVQEPAIDFGRLEQDLQRFAEPAVAPTYAQPQGRPQQDWADEYPAPTNAMARESVPQLDDQAIAPPPAFLADEEPKPRNSRRMIYLATAGLAVVLGAVALTLVARGGGKTGGEPPTILAATGPAKVQPANPGGANVATQPSSVLDRSQGDRISASRVVSREEQPVDLAAAAPAVSRPQPVVPMARPDQPFNTGAPIAAPTTASTNASGFPEPKRVKTVSVRPDGTVISPDSAAAPAAPVPARPSIAAVPPNPSAARPAPAPAVAPPAAAKPVAATSSTAAATPKATTRVANAPAQDGDAAAGTPASPSIRTAAARPTASTPSATPAAVTTGGGSGGYSVQLAAAPSEAEAKSAITRLQSRFASELGGRRPAIVKATVGEKSIYRVRVSGLSKDDAGKLCSSIQSSGGQCFVAKN
jgi:hypothetical protein